MTEDNFYILGPAGQVRIPNWPMPPLMSNHGNYIVSMAQRLPLDGRAGRGAGRRDLPRHVLLGTGLWRRRRGRGRRRGRIRPRTPNARRPGPSYEPGMELRGKYVFLAEGVRGSLSKQVIAKYDLSKGHDPQKFGLGMKEIWEIDPEKHREGTVTHTMGWPLGRTRAAESSSITLRTIRSMSASWST